MSKMQFVGQSGSQTQDRSFVEEIRGGTNLNRCYQCLTCSLGCPVTAFMDYLPHQMIRMVQYGLKEQVLNSSTIWICASCETCVTRCPNEVDIPQLMDCLKEMALKEGVKSEQTAIVNLHETFMQDIKSYGKSYELGLLMKLKLKNKDYFADVWPLGIKMMLKRKLKLLPPGGKAKSDVKAIFDKAGES